MDKYEKAIEYFFRVMEAGDIRSDEQQEIYEIAIEALTLQKKAGSVQLDNPYWVSKEGKIVEFKEMTRDYLGNVINMLKRNYSKEMLEDSITFGGLVKEYMLR